MPVADCHQCSARTHAHTPPIGHVAEALDVEMEVDVERVSFDKGSERFTVTAADTGARTGGWTAEQLSGVFGWYLSRARTTPGTDVRVHMRAAAAGHVPCLV